MPAPQTNAMAAVIQPLMAQQPAMWTLYIVSATLALVLTVLTVNGLNLTQQSLSPL